MLESKAAEVGTSPFRADDESAATVPLEYQGTETDRHDMSMLGKRQVLRRQFRFWTMLGFASTVMVAWELSSVRSRWFRCT